MQFREAPDQVSEDCTYGDDHGPTADLWHVLIRYTASDSIGSSSATKEGTSTDLLTMLGYAESVESIEVAAKVRGEIWRRSTGPGVTRRVRDPMTWFIRYGCPIA